MKTSRHQPDRQPDNAFTLIELLVVIAIIATLAGLAFPAMQGALQSGKKAQARNDVNQIAAAFKAFQLEYGRLPGTGSGTAPAPDNWVSILTGTNSNNPRGIVFFEPKAAKGGKGGSDGTTYFDPWGAAYKVYLDYDYDNKILTTADMGLDPGTNFTTAVVVSSGPDSNIATTTDNISNLK